MIKSYIIPIEDLTLQERVERRKAVDNNLLTAAKKLGIRDNDEDFLIRDTLPNTDVGLAATRAWLVAGAGVAGTELQYFSTAIAVDTVVMFWGVSYETVPQDISVVRFTLGAASTETRGIYQIEELFSRLVPEGYLSDPIYYVRNETARVLVEPRVAFAVNTQRLKLLSRTIEVVGNIVSARQLN